MESSISTTGTTRNGTGASSSCSPNRLVRFDSPHVTADSAYFAGAPTAAPPLTGNRHGTLRLSVCPAGEKICRLVEMAVVWQDAIDESDRAGHRRHRRILLRAAGARRP